MDKAGLDSAIAIRDQLLRLYAQQGYIDITNNNLARPDCLQAEQLDNKLHCNKKAVLKTSHVTDNYPYNLCYDIAPVGYLSLDAKGNIFNINHAAVRLLERPRSYLVNKLFTSLLNENNISDFEYALEQVFEFGQEHKIELSLKREDNSCLDLLMQVVISYDTSKKPIALAVITDISKQKHIERELIKVNNKYEEYSQEKSKFISRMSHELRTPLNAIIGFAQLLNQYDADTVKENIDSHVNQILTASWHLLGLINDVLDLGKLETNKLKLILGDIDLDKQINDSISELRNLASEANVTVTYLNNTKTMNKLVHAHSDRLKQVLLNLISNAIKFNHDKGTVKISCKPVSNKRIRITVKDSGYGIANKYLATLFEPFNPLYLESYAEKGAGVGLAITKRLVEMMGGYIGVESEPDKGSKFWIELNLSE